MKLNRYPKYKPTGIAWLPEVPEGWEVRKVRQHFRLRSEKVSEQDYPPLSVAKVGVVPQLADVAISMAQGETRKLVRAGDYVVNSRSDRKGSCGIAPQDGSVTTISIVLEPRQIDRQFVHYLFRSTPWVEEFYRNGRGIVADLWTTRYQEMRNMAFPLPPLPTQRVIVAFLDGKCGKIDRWVAAKEREVALLKELKQAMIAEAVTGATHVARTDTARKKKPSGIPWLPEVPEGWEVKKVRQLAREGKTKNKGNVEKNVLSLSYGHIIRKKEVYSGLVPTDFATYQIVEKDYVVLRLTDLQNDHKSLRCGLVCERGIITSAYVSLVPQNVLPAYLYLALHTCDLNKVFYSMGGGLRQSMNFADVGNLFVPLPPLAEQRAIVAYIEARAAKIDAAVAGLEREVAAMKEYKQRLIADVVTGQKKVA